MSIFTTIRSLLGHQPPSSDPNAGAAYRRGYKDAMLTTLTLVKEHGGMPAVEVELKQRIQLIGEDPK
jgi:hypothetical protein